MMIRALVPYFGAKRLLGSKIAGVLGRHQAYWEPFCGSLAVLFAKEPSRMEVANDLNGELANLVRVVQNNDLCPQLYEHLQRTAVSPASLNDATRVLQSAGHHYPGQVIHAWAYFTVSWLGRNGMAGTAGSAPSFCVRNTSNGGDPAVRFRSAVESIPGWWKRLQGVTILQQDGIELCERIEDKPGTVIYADPPYVEKNARYLWDFAEADHERLAQALRHFDHTRVVVSYYDHPWLDDLYLRFGFKKIDCATRKLLGDKTDAPEVLLVKNGEEG